MKNGDAEADIANWTKGQVQVTAENPHSGKNCFKTLSTSIVSSELIPVDTTKTYKISGWFKSADDKKTNLYLGLMPLDADKKHIQCVFVNALPGSETELAEPCKAEDTVLKVKDASKWVIKNKYNHVAFETDNSGAFKDLPNSKITSSIVKVEQNGTVWDLTLEKPCGKAYPANTPVRIQRDGATYMYPVVNANFQSPEWKEITGQVKGLGKSGTSGLQFWPGTKYVKVIILALNGGMFYFDDVKFEEVE
ncbi:MAG: hypothetical protein EOM23_05835 [Candidatus Moranbacteria bacterium]|nr:hypothetical protein [Candidatus Moranbacteria bacterium]